MSETEIKGGIEWFEIPGRPGETDHQCARCGSSVGWYDCWDCGGGGLTYHDCGEDTCACLHPEINVQCDSCTGEGGAWHCISTPAWCKANPLPGRDHIASTALSHEAWGDAR